MQINELKKNKKRVTKKRVGRGGLRGKTSGRGHKGQKARSGGGGSERPYIREDIKRIPKRSGYGKNRARTVNDNRVKPQIVSIDLLNSFEDKEIDSYTLLKLGIVKKSKGRVPSIKILGTGSINRAVMIRGIAVSKTVKETIEKKGGKIS